VDDVKAYLESVIKSYDDDPADDDYQQGYLEAMRDVYNAFFTQDA